jgi:hypothetical protein
MRRFTSQEKQAQKKLINDLYDRFYLKKSKSPGMPAKYDMTPAGPQGNMFIVQAQAPKKAITSDIPLSKQIKGTMFEPQTPEAPNLFDEGDK